MNNELIARLASKQGEAQLRSICLSLNQPCTGITLETGKSVKVNMLECVDYGINNPVSFASIADVFSIPHK